MDKHTPLAQPGTTPASEETQNYLESMVSLFTVIQIISQALGGRWTPGAELTLLHCWPTPAHPYF